MVTSAMDEEGKSTTLANLAIALARAGRRVVVIDAIWPARTFTGSSASTSGRG